MPELPEGFDLAALLAPIPGDAPAGRDLRQDESLDAPYFRLRDARREASAAERAAEAPQDEAGPRPALVGLAVSSPAGLGAGFSPSPALGAGLSPSPALGGGGLPLPAASDLSC